MERYLTPDDLDKALRRDVADGLTAVPKVLPPKWFYDERGSTLFEEITRLPEYYPTRRERAILIERAAEIATRQIAADYPDMAVRAVVADYERHLHLLPAGDRRLIAFLGGTIGNMPPAARIGFLGAVRASMASGDALLLGADLVKDTDRLVAAYDDAQGVTAEFNRNVLHVINRELGADFAAEEYEHVAIWDPANEWIEMRLRATTKQSVSIGQLDMRVDFAAGEELRTEISAKFRRDRMERELGMAGLAATSRTARYLCPSMLGWTPSRWMYCPALPAWLARSPVIHFPPSGSINGILSVRATTPRASRISSTAGSGAPLPHIGPMSSSRVPGHSCRILANKASAAAATLDGAYCRSLCPPATITMSGMGRHASWRSNSTSNGSWVPPGATNPVPPSPPMITCQPRSRAVPAA